MSVHFGSVSLSRQTPRIVAAVGYGNCLSMAMAAHQAGADILELRLDHFPNLDTPAGRKAALEEAREIKQVCPLPLLATIRRKQEGGSFPADEQARIDLYLSLLPFADAVDVELKADDAREQIIGEAARRHTPVVLSYHDFKACPDDATLERLLEEGFRHGATLVKIAVTPRQQSDVIRLLALTERNADLAIITIAMGDLGRISRVMLPIFGSRLTYGCVGEEKLAPGQLRVKEVRDMLNLLAP